MTFAYDARPITIPEIITGSSAMPIHGFLDCGSGSALRFHQYEHASSATISNSDTITETVHAGLTANSAEAAFSPERIGSNVDKKHQPALPIMATPSTTLCDSERIRCVRFSRAIWRPNETTISRISRPPTPAIQPSCIQNVSSLPKPAGKIARPSITVVAHTTESKPATTEIT